MQYRRLGRSGLKVSELSFGSWVSFGGQMGLESAAESLKIAYDAGVNFFDNAEVYAGGESERLMGQAFKKLGWRRSSYLVSTKFFWGLENGVNESYTLNRKYLLESIDGSLKRLDLDHVDLIYCHRPDKETPIEETVWAMSDIISSGKALYWGTSEWSAQEITDAIRIAERERLHRPIVEQPEYNLLNRFKVEKDYQRLFQDFGIGTTTFSPLASGLLTGKYNKGVPADSRASLEGYDWLKSKVTDPDALRKVQALEAVAANSGISLPNLAIAWCTLNPNVSTVILGASRPSQLVDNLKSIEVREKLTPEVLQQIEAAVA